MTLRAAALAAMFAVTSLGIGVPSMAASAAQQETGQLPHGGEYILSADPALGAATIGLWFRAPGAGYDNGDPGISRLAATAAAAAPLASGKSLVQLVRSLGGDFSISVYPDIVGVDAVVPASAVRQVVAGMTAAYFAPSIDGAAVKMAQRDGAVLSVQQRYSSDLALHDVLFEHIFASGPAHFPPLPNSVAALTKISQADVSTFAKRAFRSQNAVLTLTGNVDSSSIGAVTDGSGSGNMDAPFDSALAPAPSPTTVPGQVSGIGLAWVGPPIADQKAATALDFVADYLFRPKTGTVAKALDERSPQTFLTGQFVTLHDPGIMLVTIGGDDAAELQAAKERVLDQLRALARPMEARAFDAAREAFLYHVAADTQTPQGLADNLGWYAVEGSATYAPGSTSGDYTRQARSLDPSYVAEVVQRYLSAPLVITMITAAPAKVSS
jgi:predicted Zn-dependent peptidase